MKWLRYWVLLKHEKNYIEIFRTDNGWYQNSFCYSRNWVCISTHKISAAFSSMNWIILDGSRLILKKKFVLWKSFSPRDHRDSNSTASSSFRRVCRCRREERPTRRTSRTPSNESRTGKDTQLKNYQRKFCWKWHSRFEIILDIQLITAYVVWISKQRGQHFISIYVTPLNLWCTYFKLINLSERQHSSLVIWPYPLSGHPQATYRIR